MAPSAQRDNWDESDEESTPPSSPPPQQTRQKKFDDEEDDSEVLESWDAEEDSDVEREKAKAAEEAKAKADAAAKASKKSKSQRIEEHRMANMKKRQEDEEDDSEESEDEAERRQRMRRMEKEADLKNAEDLFGGLGVNDDAKAKGADRKKTTIQVDPSNPASTVDLATLGIFKPSGVKEFTEMREVVASLVNANSKKAPYASFAVEFSKLIARDLSSEQIKKIASGLTTLGNEKMKEEKASEKGGKKSKAAKKTTLNATRDTIGRADTRAYDDDGLGDDDFM